MPTYIYREESGYDEEFGRPDDKAAEEYGLELLRNGDWGQETAAKTFRVRASLLRKDIDDGEDGDGNPYETGICELVYEFEPVEPKCLPGQEHEWKDGGPNGELHQRGHVGGVIITTHCTVCGLGKVYDTWDTDPANGENVTTTEYLRRKG